MDKLFVNVGRSLNTSVRRLSSFNNNRFRPGIISLVNNEDLNIWAESNWSEFGRLLNKSAEFPLPGQVGIVAFGEKKKHQQPNNQSQTENSENKLFDRKLVVENLNFLLNQPLPQDNQILKLKEAAGGLFFQDKMEKSAENHTLQKSLELKAYKCPISLQKDFENYFRSQFFVNAPLTVITISLKTKNDMSLWNSQVESEREAIMKNYFDTATELCSILKGEGFWADFIDPSSGRPYNSPYTHATFYETDERYNQLGFEIIDYGCCKVISHHLWGTKTYVGCLLTTASLDSKAVKTLTEKFNVD